MQYAIDLSQEYHDRRQVFVSDEIGEKSIY